MSKKESSASFIQKPSQADDQAPNGEYEKFRGKIGNTAKLTEDG